MEKLFAMVCVLFAVCGATFAASIGDIHLSASADPQDGYRYHHDAFFS